MASKPQNWIIRQLGAREHYALAVELHARGRLAGSVTDAWLPSNSLLAYLPYDIGRRYAERYEHSICVANVPPGSRKLPMNGLEKLRRFASRVYSGQRLGLFFTGTSRFGVPQKVRLAGGVRDLCFPDGDGALALDVIEDWLDDDYGLGKVTRPVSTFLDIGANVGLLSLWAWHHFPSARIHAYEPNPAILSYLKMNVKGLTQIQVFAEGVSDQDSCAHMITGTSSRLAQTQVSKDGGIKIVSIRRAIDRVGGMVDLLKLDCEGAEWEIFKDAKSLSAVREIRMEYHLTEGRKITDLINASNSLGFDLSYLRENEGFGIAYLTNKLNPSLAR